MTEQQISNRRAKVEREAFAVARGYVAENPLRSCPFCGGAAGVLAVGYHDGPSNEFTRWKSAVQIGCADESCGVHVTSGGVVGAVKKWNRRANEGQPHIERVEQRRTGL